MSGDGSTTSVNFGDIEYCNIAYTSGSHIAGVYGNVSGNFNNLGNNYSYTIPAGTTKY